MSHNRFRIESSNGTALNRATVELLTLNFKEGHSRASLNNPQTSRELKDYRKHLKELMEKGAIDDGTRTPYDDRKTRFNKAVIADGRLDVFLGYTTYPEFQEDYQRTDKENLALQQKGQQQFADPFAYFARPIGVAGVVITREGKIIIGVRNNDVDGGSLCGVAGNLEYADDISHIDLPGKLAEEAHEELGIAQENIQNSKFVGIYADPIRGDLDFAFLMFTDLPATYFTSGQWKANAIDDEHTQLISIDSYEVLQHLLNDGILPSHSPHSGIMYSTQGALMSVRPEDIGSSLA
jgi:8-oxo-dGTP pyrophosphatase MutT (NUDIX family)